MNDSSYREGALVGTVLSAGTIPGSNKLLQDIFAPLSQRGSLHFLIDSSLAQGLQCNTQDTDYAKYQYWYLDNAPTEGQWVEVSFEGGNQERFFICNGNSNAATGYVANLLPGQSNIGFTWTGGVFYFSFQICNTSGWVDLGRDAAPTWVVTGEYSYEVRLGDAKAIIKWGQGVERPAPPVPTIPPAPPTPVYTIEWLAMHSFRTVSHVSDTVYAALSAKGPAGNYGPVNWGPLKLRREYEVPNIARIEGIAIPRDANVALDISWGAVNSGHSDAAEVAGAVGNAVLNLASGIIGGSLVGDLAVLLGKFGLGMVVANCDAALFAGHVRATGLDLYSLTSQPNGWVFQGNYDPIHGPCGDGHYNATLRVTRTAG